MGHNNFEIFIYLDCQFSNCYVTNDTNYFGKGQTDNFDAIIFGLPIKMSDEVKYSKKNQYHIIIIRAATAGKASKALPESCRIESGGSSSSGGMLLMRLPLWRPCLPKIGHGGPDYYHK